MTTGNTAMAAEFEREIVGSTGRKIRERGNVQITPQCLIHYESCGRSGCTRVALSFVLHRIGRDQGGCRLPRLARHRQVMPHESGALNAGSILFVSIYEELIDRLRLSI